MSLIYQEFRKRVLEELRVEMPELGYRQKIKIISEKWKQYKLTQVTAMDLPEMGKLFLGENEEDIYEGENIQRLKYTVEALTETVFSRLEYEGENLLLQLSRRFMRTRPPGDKFLIWFVKKFIACGEALYSLRLMDNEFDIIDLVIFYQRSEVIYYVLAGAPRGWIRTASPGKQAAAMGLLFTVLKGESEMTRLIMNLVQQFISDGLDPNLEIGDVICGASVSSIYEINDPTYKELISRYPGEAKIMLQCDKFVHYTGINDVCGEYRRLLSKMDRPVSIDTSSLDLVGQTVFSVFLHHAKNYRHRRFCEHLIKTKQIRLTTVVVLGNEAPTSYQTMVFRKPTVMIASLADFIIKETPPHMFYIKSANDPIKALFNSMTTTWDYMVLINGGHIGSLQRIFEHCLVLPDKNILRHLIFHPGFLARLVATYKNFNRQALLTKAPLSPLIKLYLEGSGLDMLVRNVHLLSEGDNKDTLLSLASEKYKTLTQVANRAQYPQVINTMFVFSGLNVTPEMLEDPLMTFVTEDGFVFHRDEFEHLVDKKHNPFNRQPLSESDLSRLQVLLDTFREWWFLYESIPDLPTPPGFVLDGNSRGEEMKNQSVVRCIDEILDECPFFSYGDRLRDHYDTLKAKLEHVQATYMYLLSNPHVCIQGTMADGFQASCFGFQTHLSDPHVIEEINIYYGVRITQLFSDNPPPLSVGIGNLISWIYLILDASKKYCDSSVFYGRVITLYFVVSNFLRRLTESNATN